MDDADLVPAAGRGRAGVALSLVLHVAVAWAVFFGGDSVRELPSFLDEPVEVVLVDWPVEEGPEQVEQEATTPEEQEAEEESDAVPPPLPESEQAEAEPPAAEAPEEEQTEPAKPEAPEPEAPEPEASEPEVAALPEPVVPPQATPRVLIPVTEFAEEDSGSDEQSGEIGLREGVEETSEVTSEDPAAQTATNSGEEAPGESTGDGPGGTPSDQSDEGPAEGEVPAVTGGEAEAAQAVVAEEVAPDSETDAGTEVAALSDPVAPGETETTAEVQANAEGAGGLDVLGTPGEGPGEIAAGGSGLPAADTRVLPREKPADLAVPAASGERIDLAALADLGARAEAVSRALATRRREAGGGNGGGGGEITGGTTATRLFSRNISDDPRMRTAMNGMPQAARVDLLCMTELRAQLRAGRPPYHADLLPSFRFEAGNVLQPRRAAFRAGGQWYELAFRCELNAGVTRVESFTYRVGEPVPRAEWSARGFPGN